MSTTLVTGGAGYVGSHTVERLLDLGRRVVVLDDLSTGHIEVVRLFERLYGPERFAFEQIDLCDADAVARVFEAHVPAGVIDFAAKSLVGESQSEPRAYFDTNVVGFRNLAQAAGVVPIVKSTTAATYGDPEPDDLPLREDYQDRVVDECRFEASQLMPAAVSFDALLSWYDDEVAAAGGHLALTDRDRRKLMLPTNVYGITKLMDELILEKRWRESGGPFTALRYFNVAGASESALIGEDHDPETHLIPIAFQAALGLRDAVTIFGTDYATPDGTAIRDYVSVRELADAHVACLDRMVDSPGGYTYNLGTREGFSVREIIDTASSVSGRPVPYVEGDRRSGDPERLIADAGRVAAEVGWTAKASLEETMSRAWRWHRYNPGGFRAIQEERYNPFWGRWITVAATRASRPWSGETESGARVPEAPTYDPACYLCPGNRRTSGIENPVYPHTYAFPNDFPAMTVETYAPEPPGGSYAARPATGTCEVIVYSPDHSQRLATMSVEDIAQVVEAWIEVYDRLGARPEIDYVMIFENRGGVMGNSQLHPHGQVYAYGAIPDLMVLGQVDAFEHGDFVDDALRVEREDGRRVLLETDAFCAFVPFAAWLPYDVTIVPKRAIRSLSETTDAERRELAGLLKRLLGGLDALFGQPYQYSMALIQAPTDGRDRPFHAQIHISSLLRGPSVRKHIVGTDIFGRSVNPSDPNVSAAEIRRAIARANGEETP